jgi:hypothetical protein
MSLSAVKFERRDRRAKARASRILARFTSSPVYLICLGFLRPEPQILSAIIDIYSEDAIELMQCKTLTKRHVESGDVTSNEYNNRI